MDLKTKKQTIMKISLKEVLMKPNKIVRIRIFR